MNTLKSNKANSMALIAIVLSSCLLSCQEDDRVPTIAEVVTGAISKITTSTAELSGSISSDGNSSLDEVGFVYSSAVNTPTTADERLKATPTGNSFTAELTGLSSGTKYYVRAYAVNSLGTAYGDVISFSTGNAAPIATNVDIIGSLEVNKEVTAAYNFSDSEGDLEGETAYQWYVADDAAGNGEMVIQGATQKTLTLQESHDSKFVFVAVTPKALTGTIQGTPARSLLKGPVGEATTVTFLYNGSSVTYGIIVRPSGKRWMDRNLGATRVAESSTDFLAYGDMFQWGRLADGHQKVTRASGNTVDMIGETGITSTVEPYETSATNTPTTNKFIIDKGINGDWRSPQESGLWQGIQGINNPCPTGWRIPTKDEWLAEGMTDIEDAYTKLKLTYSGFRRVTSGAFASSTTSGYAWTSTVDETHAPQLFSIRVSFNTTTFGADIGNRGNGYPCRCIKD